MLGTIQGIVGKPITFQGYANDYDKAISAIEFSLDGGKTWTHHATACSTTDKLLTWEFVYTPQRSGHYQLRVRAVNEEGTISPISDSVDFIVEE
ncbi:MAG: molybdopterin-binding protein [Raoultibacter sp.]